MRDREHNFRKAVILVASLEPARREALLAQLPPEQADALRHAADALGALDPSEQSAVIEEFFRIGPMMPGPEPSGIELGGSPGGVGGLARVQDEYVNHHEHARKPFEFLEDAHVDSIAPLLEREHPQTIAVIVSHLAPHRAAQILASLPARLQAEVAGRLVDLERLDPEVLRDVELETQRWIKHGVGRANQTAGLAALSSILCAADLETQQRLMSNLAQHDRQLAHRVAPVQSELLCFDDLVRLDSSAWHRLLHKMTPEMVVLALGGARAQIVESMLAQMPSREAKQFRAALRECDWMQAKDIKRAQQTLLHAAQQLGRGRRTIRPHSGLSLAA